MARSAGLGAWEARGAAAGAWVGGWVYDCLDATVDADGVDHCLAKNLVAAGPRKAFPSTGIHQTKRQRLVVDRDDLSVLTQHDPGKPPLRLHSLQNLRPQPPNISQPNSSGSTSTRTSLAGRTSLRGRTRRGLRTPAGLSRLGARRLTLLCTRGRLAGLSSCS